MHTSPTEVLADEERSATGPSIKVPAHPDYTWSGLYRAIVSLPHFLCERDRCGFQERVVFFESSFGEECATLEKLLASAWCCDTADWVANGFAYNILSAREWFDDWAQGVGDTRFFESHWGGPDRIGYHSREDIDFFVTPRRKVRLEAALRSVEAIEKARKRHGAAAVKVALQRVPARSA